MWTMLRVKIVLGLYSVFAVFINGSPSVTDWEFVKGFRSSPRKRETRSAVAEFEDTEEEVVAKVGETVRLGCSVKNLGDNVVSWMRRKGLLILTSGMMTFTADNRFQVDHAADESSSWDLAVHDVQMTDAGFYECQINTEPKLKRSVHLIVVSENGPTNFSLDDNNDTGISEYLIAKIIGSPERYVQVGSIVTITCYVKIIASENNYRRIDNNPVQWFFFSKLLNAQSERGGINVDTVRSSNVIVSSFTIAFVTENDAGTYTCKPISGQFDSVKLHVVQNAETGAVKPENYLQSNNAVKNDIVSWKKLFLLYPLLFIRFPT